MTDETLLTLRQLAAQLELPESTVRYYRDAFLDQIPSVGSGRRRRYPPQAVEVLRSIARSYAAGRSRGEIVTNLQHGSRPAAVAMPSAKVSSARALEDVTNLDLLAAILDGEREQREALWQMAKEIVRLTGVLEGQDKVLNEIADQAGVKVSGRLGAGTSQALGAGQPAADAGAPATAKPGPTPTRDRGPAAVSPPVTSSSINAPATAPAAPASDAPAAAALRAPAHHDMDRLREELESERALVERLREAKLQLEHRAADAEAELQERRRASVIRRIFRGDEQR